MSDTQTLDTPRLTAADDLYRFDVPADPQIAPDGRRVVYTVRRVERETDLHIPAIRVVNL